MTKKFEQKAGYGSIFPNQYKTEKTHPDFTGYITFTEELLDAAERDGRVDLALWKQESEAGKKYLSVKVNEKYNPDEKKAEKKVKKDDVDDDLDL